MAKHYASGELPQVGDRVRLDHGAGPEGRVVVVVGGESAGASSHFNVTEWEYLGPGILLETQSMGLVYYDDPSKGIIRVNTDA